MFVDSVWTNVLVFAIGQYTLVSMALNTLGVQLDEGIAGFPEDPDGAPER